MIPLGSNVDSATHDICQGGNPNPQACVHSNQCGDGNHKSAPFNKCFSDYSEIWFRGSKFISSFVFYLVSSLESNTLRKLAAWLAGLAQPAVAIKPQ